MCFGVRQSTEVSRRRNCRATRRIDGHDDCSRHDVKVGGNVQSAKCLRQPTPVYPPLAKQARISGVVYSGSRDQAPMERRKPAGDERASIAGSGGIEAVSQWVYKPTLLNGEPVEVLTQIEVHFKLGE